MTNKHYVVKPAVAPDVSDILERLGASGSADNPIPVTTGQTLAA